MTRATEYSTKSEAVDQALRVARSAALTAATGTGSAGLFLGRQGVSLAKKGYTRARTTPVKKAAQGVVGSLTPGDSTATRTKSTRGRRLAIGVLIGSLIAGGAVLFKISRREHPPIATAPPRLEDLEEQNSAKLTSPDITSAPTTN
ncbi:hypothetical protein [Rhodococcus sp. USK13]|uniref:hypothetical protein n=1 Tax=Rhodococcus sp. USK13 TaxID=2806442 RepID=UPI001BCB82C6|nr:hypothetical protein [Rhodococcus sp. USK13]